MAMASSVRLISTSTVYAANDGASSDGRIELNPGDLWHLQLGYIQKGLLFPKPDTTEKTLMMMIQHLKTSLSHTLHHFPPLAGRLATTRHEQDDTISFFIDCNNTRALFLHTSADGVTISDVINPVHVPPIVHSFFPLNDLRNYDGIANPLLGIQVTNLADAIFIGCSINHVVADGTSFWHFLNSWSEISKGSIRLSKPPVLRRWFPRGMDIPIRIPLSCIDVKQSDQDVVPPLVRERIFHFSKESIAELKAKANAEIGTHNISSLQALSSHIWRSVVRNRSFDPNQETKYWFAVGLRQRSKELPSNYFGNVITEPSITMKAKELMEFGIGKPAWQMNRKIATITEESFKKSLEAWQTSPSFITLNYIGNTLVVISSPRFNIYGNDFGWGKPIAVRSGPSNKCDGILTFFSGAEEGSIEVEACLFPDTLEAMANDVEFMDMVTL